ncbi:Nucleotide-binding universal stress protein, UspA family [Geodermatophilus telluris]|uniref:Nucleotide-binding universal stress protein, UspA family n=1 Tax=Geodermatophilus telluris TaxID=1190417 RepID=A0A1G6VAI4_9ACTN|nr:universal stress protein [Geodermatophilus telluris]SDD50474.1 Nucleotide-binding universal stress protein, UspA family [Geodermatophilus telluris]
MEPTSPGGAVVVGVDGSACAREALTWAAVLAARAGMALTVVRAWSIPTAPRPDCWEPGYVPPVTEYERAVRQAVADDLAAAGVPPGVRVECRAVHRAPVDALVAAADGADLLVVGARGRGGAAGRLVGSVSSSVLRAAPCPVTVVRSGTAHRPEGASRAPAETPHAETPHADEPSTGRRHPWLHHVPGRRRS